MAKRSVLLPMLDNVARLPLLRERAGADEHLIEQAWRLADAAGGEWDDLAPALGALLRAYREEAALSPFGALAAHWDVERFMTNLRRFLDEEARAPEILAEPVTAPLIVTGMPRSGTSFLHGLLAEDPANQVVRCWQTVYPYPDADREGKTDRRARRVDWQLWSFAWLAPGLRSVHPLDAQSPQECTEITAHMFQSLRFDTTHRVPSYRAWLDARGHGAAYRFHRRFLKHLQAQHGRRRWVLKSPDHVFALDALHAVYPDARMVFVHRDPSRILPSVANLTEVLRAPFTLRTDAAGIGRQVIDDWALGAANMVEASRRWRFGSPPPFHAQYHEIVARPVETVRRLYRHFGMTLSDAAAERIGRRAAARPNGGYGRNVYSAADYGFDLRDMRQRFRAYLDHFDVLREVPPVIAAAEQGGPRAWSNPSRPRQHAGS
jgi:hypothetical protein